jgi:gliding motility-associated-like protein
MMKPFFTISLLLLFSLCAKAQAPTATIVAPSGTLCTGTTYSFTTNTANSPDTYSWTIFPSTSTTISPDKASPFIAIDFGRGGIYQFSLQVSNNSGTTTTTYSVSVNQNAIASFNASLTASGYPTQMILTNYSSYTVSNKWFYSDAAPDTTVNTVKNYTASGTYSITLVAYGMGGCNDTSGYSFRIADSSGITMPDIFTPNNDSINDIYRPIARGISSLRAWVFNRYGTLIYNWDGVNGFWDGYTTSGNPCQPDVYFCVLEATGFDGKTYKLKSKVTLLR